MNKTIAETFEIQMWPIDDGNGVKSTLDPLLIIGIAGGAALVIIVIVLYLRKKK